MLFCSDKRRGRRRKKKEEIEKEGKDWRKKRKKNGFDSDRKIKEVSAVELIRKKCKCL